MYNAIGKKYGFDRVITYKNPHCTRRTTGSRLSTVGMSIDKIRDILGQVDEKTTLGYIYNPNTEQENLNIMNNAFNSSAHFSATKKPLKIKGFRKRETLFEP